MSTDEHSGDDRDENSALVGEFALGLLAGEEHARMARRIAAEPALREELRLWQGRLSSLDHEFVESTAPAGILSKIEGRLFGPVRGGAGSWWNSLMLWRSVAAASLALAIVAVGVNVMQPRLSPEQFATELVAALHAQEGSGVEFVALYDPGSASVRLTALSGEVEPDRDLELWYIAGDEPAVSMGVIPVGRTEIELDPEARAKFGEGVVLALTLEQKGGSPTGVAQGPIVAVGAATAI
jgi:anti-sigma-K factor RskA